MSRPRHVEPASIHADDDDPSGVSRRWPAERFYWAVLDAPGLELRGPLPDSLRDELQDAVPVSVDSLHAVVVPCRPGWGWGTRGLTVCAAMRDAIAALPPHVLSLTPREPPAFLAGAIDPHDLNLLIGEHEPAPIRAHRRRRRLIAAGAAAVAVWLCALGLARRAESDRDLARRADEAVARLLDGSGIPRDDPFVLARRIEELRRATAAVPAPAPDAAESLALALRRWPADVEADPTTLSIASERLSLAVEVNGEPGAFLRAFQAPAGWMLDEPRVSQRRGVTLINLELRPAAQTGGAR